MTLKKLLPLILFIIILCCMPFLLSVFVISKKNVFDSSFFAMDTVVTVSSSDDISNLIRSRLNSLEAQLDCYNSESDIFKLNTEKEMQCPDELVSVISQTITLNNRFGSLADISGGNLTMLWGNSIRRGILPEENEIAAAAMNIDFKNIHITGNTVCLENNVSLDLGAVAKGFALDEIRNICAEKNTGYAVISTGSSLLLYGEKPGGKPFSIKIRDPDDPDGSIGTLKTTECFISTSGGYERFFEIDEKKYHHIIDLSAGYPADTSLTSVTVIADSGILSDFLSTHIFIEGTDNIGAHLRAADYKIIAIDTGKNIYVSEGLDFTAE